MRFLFDVSGLTPHGFCLAWQPGLLWLTAGANLLIAVAYFCIPAALAVLLLRGRAVPYKPVLALFAGFIVACGTTHVLTAVTLWVPLYWISGTVDAITAILSVMTAVVVWPVIAQILGVERQLHEARSAADASLRQLQELALTDSLTGLANRRHFDVFLDTEIRRANRAGTSIALVMIDADKFKPFNDMYGHPAGDACLCALATTIPGQLRRAGDLAARFSGDEFAVILPGADEAGAARIAERIIQAISGLAILNPGTESGVVTASAGVAAFVPSATNAGSQLLLQQADAALYAAKEGGGNQVCTEMQAASLQPDMSGHTDSAHQAGADEKAADWTARMPTGTNFVNIVRGFPVGIVVTDGNEPDHPIIFANAGFTTMTGYSLRESVGRNPRFLQGPETDRGTLTDIANAIRQGLPIRREVLNYRKTGESFWNELFVQPLMDKRGGVVGFVGLQIDQTARYRAEQARTEVEARLAGIVENFPGYIYQRVLKPTGKMVYSYFSQSYWRITGISMVPNLADYEPLAHIHPADVEIVRSAVANSLANLSSCTIEFRTIRPDGSHIWIRTHATPRELGDGNVVWDGVGVDVSAEMASKESLAYLAYHDPLTGLCNRVLFIQTLESLCVQGLNGPRRIAVLSIDVDAFQTVNDTLGAPVGDAVLRHVADRLSTFAGSTGVAARLGGDEFGVATEDMQDGVSIADKAEALCHALQQPMQIGEHEIAIQVCVGATCYPFADRELTPGKDAAEELMKQSNFALAEAKHGGSGIFRVYSKALDDRERNRTTLRHSMRQGLKEQQFVLHYHPFVDLSTGEIIGAEALVRWAHPVLGMQRPDLFIPEAESSGLIIPLGAWVIRTALFEMQEWEKRCARPLRISINVSAVQLYDPGFIEILDEALADSGADPRMVDLELTESVLIEGSTMDVLQTLRDRGFRLAVDDFGTGYSSFRYLKSLPVSKVKIDQSFVRHMVIDSSDASIVRAIAAVARSMDLEVIAEGIETPTQRDFLRNEGCPVGQGYLFSLPLAMEDFRWLLTSNATLPLGETYAPPARLGRPALLSAVGVPNAGLQPAGDGI
jgi:diguanylate cyclase (GGDEF)-like protein/PAS domain S-box-containing protein